MNQPALRIDQLSKVFPTGLWTPPTTVLDEISLEVPAGEVMGLLGPNGAGKTTLFRVVLGLIHPSQGAAWIFGHPVTDYRARRLLGFLPESPYLYEHLTPDTCLTFFGHLCGLGGDGLTRRIEDLLDLVGLLPVRHRRLRTFSKGMLQRIGIAQALINDPAVLLLDEPMSGLDPIGRKEMRAVILDLKRTGKTIVMSTHLIHDVESLCDRVAILRRGTVAAVRFVEAMRGAVNDDGGAPVLEALYCGMIQDGGL